MLSSGTRIGPSRIKSWLGDGSLGQSYECEETEGEEKGREVYVKLIPREISERKGFKDYFLQECQAIEQLAGPGIWPIKKFGVMKWKHWVYYPWLQGHVIEGKKEDEPDGITEEKKLCSLLDYISHEPDNIDPDVVLQVMIPLHQAFARAHMSGVVHGNLKPSNVLVQQKNDQTWDAWATEFGLWKMNAFQGVGEDSSDFSYSGTNLQVQESRDESTKFRPPNTGANDVPSEKWDLFALGQIVQWIISEKEVGQDDRWEEWEEWARKATQGDGFQNVATSMQEMPGQLDLSEYGVKLDDGGGVSSENQEQIRIKREREWALQEKFNTLRFRRNMTGLVGGICFFCFLLTTIYTYLRPSPWSEYSMDGILDNYQLGAGLWSGQAWGIVPSAYDDEGKGGQIVVGEWEKDNDLLKLSFRKFKINPKEEGDKKLWQFIGTGKTGPDDYHNWQDYLRFDRGRDALILVKRVDKDSEYFPGSLNKGKPRLFPRERFESKNGQPKPAELAFVHQGGSGVSFSLFIAVGFLLATWIYQRELSKLNLDDKLKS